MTSNIQILFTLRQDSGQPGVKWNGNNLILKKTFFVKTKPVWTSVWTLFTVSPFKLI